MIVDDDVNLLSLVLFANVPHEKIGLGLFALAVITSRVLRPCLTLDGKRLLIPLHRLVVRRRSTALPAVSASAACVTEVTAPALTTMTLSAEGTLAVATRVVTALAVNAVTGSAAAAARTA